MVKIPSSNAVPHVSVIDGQLTTTSRDIAATFGKQGIRCNGILPGVIQTPAQMAWANPAMDAAFLDLHNVPRLGLPEDIASLALFLASDESAYINGTLMRADGGMSCTVPYVQVVRNLLIANKGE